MLKNINIYVKILILGLIYYVFVCFTGISIPCMFYKVTGLLCPGCGITRMILSIIKLDFVSAFFANQFIFVTIPFLLLEILFNKKIEKTKFKKVNNILIIIYFLLLIVFGIARNLK